MRQAKATTVGVGNESDSRIESLDYKIFWNTFKDVDLAFITLPIFCLWATDFNSRMWRNPKEAKTHIIHPSSR
jgi:hypothetical protein